MALTDRHATVHEGELGCPVHLGDVDLFSPGAQEHWFEAYRILHDDAPVLTLAGEGTLPGTDAFVLTKYDDIAAVIHDPVQFPFFVGWNNQEQAAAIVAENGFSALHQSADTLRPNMEMHRKQRLELTGPWVGPQGSLRHTDMITRVANELVDEFIDDGEVEWVSQFAAELPHIVTTGVIGFPQEDSEKTRKWADAQVVRFVYGHGHNNLLTEEETAANSADLADFFEYTMAQVAEKRANPADDMLSFLCDVTYDGRKLTDQEVAGVAFQMNIGGHDTTRYVLVSEAQVLAEHPPFVTELREDRSKVRFFVEEALRLYAPTQGLSTRLVAEDAEIRGVKVPKGSVLHLRYGAANRDPDLCENPERFELGRPNPGKHLTFSMNPRVCPGAGLSRLEQTIAVNVLLDRFDNLALAPDRNEFRHQPGIMLGQHELHLTFDKR